MTFNLSAAHLAAQLGRRLAPMLGLALLVSVGSGSHAVEPTPRPILEQRRFTSSTLPPPPAVSRRLQGMVGMVARLVQETGEASAVDLGLQLAPLLGDMTAEEAVQTGDLARPIYAQLSRDPQFAALPSALPWAYAPEAPTQGLYTLYLPPGADADTPVVIFLHGLGGAFLLYPWVLSRHLDDCILLFPAWGRGWESGRHAYLEAMRRDLATRLGYEPARPWLLGLATGSFGGFRIYTEAPERYAGLISVAGALPADAADSLQAWMEILMLNGDADPALTREHMLDQARYLSRHVQGYELHFFAGDALFVLREPAAVFARVRDFMNLPLPAAIPK